ncbi:MAG: DUF4097 family beta strand repeat protein [Phycisphaeraceae bacterium]|nr:DUF4097 family beta strand repeat protein [Phycisphaeraceae bacterium]
MATTRNRMAQLVGLLTCGIIAACSTWSAPFHETRELQVEHRPGSAIDIETANGAIEVEVGQADAVLIDATIKATSQERLDATEIAASRLDDGTLLLRVVWPNDQRLGPEGCSFRVTLPGAVGVRLDTSNGAIVLRGASGDADLSASNGRITVKEQDGNVTAHTSNGAVEIEHASGNVEVRSSNGALSTMGVGGSVVARTSNGRIRVALDDDSVGPIQLTSSNGSIDLDVGSAFAGVIEADTSNGRVSLEGFDDGMVASKKRTSARIRCGAGPQCRITTSNGSISINR